LFFLSFRFVKRKRKSETRSEENRNFQSQLLVKLDLLCLSLASLPVSHSLRLLLNRLNALEHSKPESKNASAAPTEQAKNQTMAAAVADAEPIAAAVVERPPPPPPLAVEYDAITGIPAEFNEYLPTNCDEFKR